MWRGDMVKIPGFDDLKKMGSDFMSSASGMVEKLKTDIETAGIKRTQDTTGELFKTLHTTLAELIGLYPSQADTIQKIKDEVTNLEKICTTKGKDE